MIKYLDQLRTFKFNIEKKRKGRKKKTVKRCLDILTFDIEVTSAWIHPKHGIIGYKPGQSAEYWNDLEKLSLPYIWQFSINDTVYYGRNIYSFLNVLDDLPKDVNFIIWVHNLGYEFQTALINIMTVDKLFARTPHDPMYAIFKEYPNVTFRCSYILTNMSLATWGDQLGIKKLVGDLDYTKLRTPLTDLTDKEMGYCERDCIVVYEGIKDHLKHYKDVFDIPLTSTGKVRRPAKELLTNDKQYMKEMKRLIPKDLDEYKRFRSVFAGGYTHGNRKYLDRLIDGPVYHVDIASSYPFVLCAYKFPYNKWAYIGRHLPDPSTFEYRAYIIKLHFTGLKCKSWNSYISANKSNGTKIITDNGRVLKADELRITVTEQDYITIVNNYVWDTIESEGTYMCHKRYLPKIFIDFILDQYKGKTELKGVDPVKYAISKSYLNSLYGMCVSAIIQADVLFDPESCNWDIDEITPDKAEYKFNKMRRWFDKSYFLSYPVGCWVTAYARRRLWSCIEKIDNDLLYTDTDSLFYLNNYSWEWFNDDANGRLKDMCIARDVDFSKTRPLDPKGKPHPLGILEYEDTADRFKTLGAKKYIEERDNKLYMTVAGINKSAVGCLPDIDSFEDGFIFDKDNDSVHKSEITYIDDMPRVIYPDGFVSDLKHGINMRPTGYKLSVPTIYSNLEDLIENFVNPNESEIIRKRGII